MIRTLTFFTNSGFYEITLPAINNEDYILAMESAKHPELKGLKLSFEVVHDIWYLLGVSGGEIIDGMRGDKSLYSGNVINILKDGAEIAVMFQESAEAFRDLAKLVLSDRRMVSIGRDKSCDIVLDYKNMVSSHHALLIFNDGSWYIKDASTNGTFVNDKKLTEEKKLHRGDIIVIIGIRMMFLGNYLAVDIGSKTYTVKLNGMKILNEKNFQTKVRKLYTKDDKLFHRSPRRLFPMKKKVFDIDNPPEKEPENTASVLWQIGPSMTMVIPMMFGTMMANSSNSGMVSSGMIMAIASAGLGVFWGVANYNKAKNDRVYKEKRRITSYTEYLEEKGQEIAEDYKQRREALERIYNPAHFYLENFTEDTLWTRNPAHEDFMYYRLGIGSMPSLAEINVTKQGFRVEKDPWQGQGEVIKKTFEELKQVPIGVNLMDYSIIGVVSEKKSAAMDILRLLAAQIAYNNCYTDMRIAAVFNGNIEEEATSLEVLKWLPHCWSPDKHTRYIAGDREEAREVFFELTQVLRDRFSTDDNNSKEQNFLPHYVLFLTEQEYLEGEIIKGYIENEKNVGLHTVIVAESITDLPNTVDFVIQNDEEFCGFYSLLADFEDRIKLSPDYIAARHLEKITRRIAHYRVKENSVSAGLPSGIEFVEMYGVHSLTELGVKNRWIKNRPYESMGALVGVKDGGKPCFLDIHEKYHGPHGLVAGTTGSGKSETLQTYLLSLAINFSPDDVAYFIIDYKGGGMANLFDGLPHMVGAISNLSGSQVQRALVSIKSENRRRQRMLNEAGVNNINSYTRLYKEGSISEPMPHLLIIVDEFAELKREEPDFMKQLISVAQVGRSLGVHLILSTQKPAGTVDENIWSNSKFRLCLRVQDVQDSKDMLKKPDAAYLTHPGRCYLQVGQDEVYELFQSGYSGAAYHEEEQSKQIASMLNLNGRVSLVGNANQRRMAQEKKRAWALKIIDLMSAYQKEHEDYSLHSQKEIVEDLQEIFKKEGMAFEKNERNENKLFALFKFLEEHSQESNEEVLCKYLDKLEKTGEELPTQQQNSQLDAVISYLHDVFVENRYKSPKPLWMDPLKERIEWRGLKQSQEEIVTEHKVVPVTLGLVDHPSNQEQFVLEYDLESMGNTLVLGIPGSGKSTFLQTLLYGLLAKHNPSQIQVYGVDFSSQITACFESFPHCGGIVFENEDEKLERLLHLLERILDDRKKLIRGQSFFDYNKMVNDKLPVILFYIDQYSNFRNQVSDDTEEFLVKLSREGVAYGIYMILSTASLYSADIASKLSKNFTQAYPLEQKDKFDYTEALGLMRVETLPEQGVKGRGLMRMDDFALEFQVALVDEALSDYDRAQKIIAEGKERSTLWQGIRPAQIPTIPENATFDIFVEDTQVQKAIEDPTILPFAYNLRDAMPHNISLIRSLGYLISGKSMTGKTNALQMIYRMAAVKKGNVYYIDIAGNALHLPEYENANIISDLDGMYKMCEEIIPILKERNKLKKALEGEDYTPEEIFAHMKDETPIFILIDGIQELLEKLQSATGQYANIRSLFENFADKGRLHKIYFIMTLNSDQTSQVLGYRFMELITKKIDGIHLGGNCISQRILNFDKLSYQQQNQALKPGYAYVSTSDEDSAQEVYVPMARTRKKGGEKQ